MISRTQRHATITTRVAYQISAADIRRAFGIPDHARVFVTVPCGGDWSGADADIDEDSPIRAEYETTEEK